MAPTILDILREGEALLGGVDSPRLSTELLVAEVLGCSRMSLILNKDRLLTVDEQQHIRSLFNRRRLGEPIAYILGSKEFYGLDFCVTPDVLIPRPETEHIIEEVEKVFPHDTPFCFADLGTGSGILAITIAHLFPSARGVAVDISPAALKVAQKNAIRHGVEHQLVFVEADFTHRLFQDNVFELIVTNPPYVTEQEYREASDEVTDFEPVGALVSGEDGLNHIRIMVPQIIGCLKPSGRLFVELGCGQGESVKKIVRDYSSQLTEATVQKDLSGHDRVLLFCKG